MMTRLLAALVLAVVCVSPFAAASAAQDPETMEGAVLGFRLTTDMVDKLSVAYKNLQKVIEADPGILTKAAQQRPAGGGGRSQTVSEVVKQFEAAGPSVVGAITGAGVTPRDFIVSQWAIAQAGVGVQMAKSGIALPDAINKDNVAFAQKHEAALMALLAEMQKLRKQ
jgi:hypothetical protein